MPEATYGEKIKTFIRNPELIRKKHRQIVRGATKLFIKKGFAETTMREISRATGLTIGNLYDYIGKKEDIFCLVFDSFHSLWIEELEKEGSSLTEDPKKQLRFLVNRLLELSHIRRDEVLLVYSESRKLPKKFLKTIFERNNRLVEYVEQILKKGVEKGVFRIEAPFMAANIITLLVQIEPLRGWNLRNRYSIEEINLNVLDFIESSISKKN